MRQPSSNLAANTICMVAVMFFLISNQSIRAEQFALAAPIKSGLSMVDKLYFSPTLKIWLDRTGDDLRGHWESKVNPPWWSAANAVELEIDFMNATGTSALDQSISALHALHRDAVQRWPLVAAELKKRGQWKSSDDAKLQQRMQKGSKFTEFRNEYADDTGWWGIAWLKMAERTKSQRYLDTAKAIHAHMAAQWNPKLDGGIIWCTEPDKQVPNSISNNLFLILSARMAVKTGEPAYRDWAVKTYDWLHQKALFDGTGVVDGPGHKEDYWSYNQGTYLGGLISFAEATGRFEVLNEVSTVAESVLTKAGFTDANGVLIEKLGTSGWDGALFKGILARYLRQTSDELKRRNVHLETAAKIDRVLASTADSILKIARQRDGQFNGDWNETPKNVDRNFNTDLSALIALQAALRR